MLRALAAILVVIDHAFLVFYSDHHATPLAVMAGHLGGIGVNVFFTISGYIMLHTSSKKFGGLPNATTFMVKRFLRIAPLYYLGTLAYILLHRDGWDGPTLLKSFLFIPYINGGEGHFYPVLGVGWTLNLEMFFYLVFAVSMIFERRIGIAFCIGLITALFVAGQVIRPDHHEALKNTLFAFYTKDVMILFAAGMVIRLLQDRIVALFARFVQGDRGLLYFLMPWFVLVLVMAVLDSMGMKAGVPKILEILSPLPLICVVACRIDVGRWFDNVFSFLGDASYSIYIFHGLVVDCLILLYDAMNLQDLAVKVILNVLICVPVSLLLYLYLEKRLQRTIRLK